MYYRQLRKGVNDTKSVFIPADDPISKHVKLGVPFQDYYVSLYKYNEEQKEKFLQTNSVKGIDDVITDRLVFDFDDENPSRAKADAEAICQKLVEMGVEEDNLQISFSGNKGFHVEVLIDEHLTPSEHKAIAKQLATGLESFDAKVYDHARPFRALGSVNRKTGLYKTNLSVQEFLELDIDQIKEKASRYVDINKVFKPTALPETIKSLKHFAEDFKPTVKLITSTEVSMMNKPKFLTNCRFALQNGHFGAGERNQALMVLAATYRNQGFEVEHTYRLLKAVAEKQSARTGQERFSDSEIWTNIVNVVYSPSWKGGQYTCREKTNWLYDYCQSLGENKCKHTEDECFIEIDDFASKFANFALNINKNTLKLGVPPVDNRVMITTSMLVGLLGAPSGGKTSLLLNFLQQSNIDGIDSVFFSMDMGLPLVYLRLIQKHFGLKKEQVFELFTKDPERVGEIIHTIKDAYSLTKFSFKTGMTVEGMRNAVLDHQEKTGRKVKLVGIDYLECINGPYSDANANTGLIANQLKDLANDLDTCVMLLLQTQKQSGDPSDPLLSMRNVKGSSVIEQACSVILSLSRPGFSAVTPENDRFATISTVKDRMGSLMSMDVGWEGLTGSFYDLSDEDYMLLKEIREKKKIEKEQANGGWSS
jgi:hypothetical protein